MKQYFSYRRLQSPISSEQWGPEKVLENSFGTMSLTWCTGIGEGLSADDKRVLACITVDGQDEADAVIEALAAFAAKKKTLTEAHNLLESITGWAVTEDTPNNKLTATVNGQNYEW